ncbi:expressed unknown protein [Seminavis robusta]|uniref:Uncharacterized protein n=1 Tax=Seminavis robusta TaxID=568900 RepID=A0A9N8DHJ9_9STRA|nr:expressed unknown protein [Seminavis robusta]|eukprot:Sro156_g070860.1 n/a (1348) ;mRNA; r:60582-64857
MADESGQSNWPLYRISEPHEQNDVLLCLPESHRRTNRKAPDEEAEENESPIPCWRSHTLFTGGPQHDNHHLLASLQGNQRFMELLMRHLGDYEQRSKMEKALVTVTVLQEWRNQNPPGRFLVVEGETKFPLWKDVGDKKARSKISKAFKYLSKTHGCVSDIVGSTKREKEDCDDKTPKKKNTPTCTESSATTCSTQFDTLIRQQQKENEAANNTTLQPSSKPPATSISISSITTTTSTSSNNNDLLHRRATISLDEETKTEPPAMLSVANIVRRVTESEEAKRAALLGQPPPRLPARFKKPQKYTRRISEQLHSAQKEGGSVYGRWKERDQLTTIYARQKQQRELYQKEGPSASCKIDVVLIEGSMGVGKTTLAQTLRHPLLEEDQNDTGEDNCKEDRPFFFFFKSEPIQWTDPTAFFAAIVTDFCEQLIEREDRKMTQRYRDALIEALKEDVTLLSNLSPALDALLTKKSWASGSKVNTMDESETMPIKEESQQETYACMAMQRLKEVFGLFLQTIASVDPEQSTILLWDDSHWMSEEAINLLLYLVTDPANAGILFLGTYREDEADDARFKRSWRLSNTNPNLNITEIHLDNLEEDSVHCMLADALSLPEEETRSLKNVVCRLTKGNPTFIKELLRLFQEECVLQFDDSTQQWTFDFEKIPLTLGNIHSVPDLFKAKVLALPDNIQETLKIAACLMTFRVDESLLKMIDTVGSVEAHLKFADIRGLLTYRNGVYWFASDGVKQAIYDLIPELERPAYHLRIGQRLWLHLEDQQNSFFYSTLMFQMMLGDTMISKEEDRRAVAWLCLDAGQKAAKYLGFQTSWRCLSYGIKIVAAQKTWGRDNYDLSLSLFNTAIEVCYANGEFSQLDDLLKQVLENARTFEDSLLARSTMIYYLGTRNRQLEAIDMGLATLKLLGETFPSTKPPLWRVYWDAHRLKSMLKGKSDDFILQMSRMKNARKVAAMSILNHVILYAVYARPRLCSLMAFRMVELTMKHGLSALSSVGFVFYGVILCRYDQPDDGFRYGELGVRISNHWKKAVWVCRSLCGFYGSIYSRKFPIRGAMEPLRTAEKAGMRAGDVEYAMLCACLLCWNFSELMSLPALENELRRLGGRVEFYGQKLSLVMIKPLWQMTLNLMGQAKDPALLKGELVDEHVEQARNGANPYFMHWMRFFQMKVSYFLGDYDRAYEYSDSARYIYMDSSGAMDGIYTMFYECMVLLAQARRGKRRYRSILHARRCLKRLQDWAYHSPVNFLGKSILLEAEIAWLRGDRRKAYERYRSSIWHSQKGGFITEEALAYEQLGRCVLEKEPEAAVPHLKSAKQLYEKWGASVIVKRLEEEFCELLGHA